MAVNQIGRESRTCAAGGRAPAAGGRRNRNGRARARLWALLNAQALLGGAAGNPDGTALIEDDRGRLAARRAD
jgi:hypothetical protein